METCLELCAFMLNFKHELDTSKPFNIFGIRQALMCSSFINVLTLHQCGLERINGNRTFLFGNEQPYVFSTHYQFEHCDVTRHEAIHCRLNQPLISLTSDKRNHILQIYANLTITHQKLLRHLTQTHHIVCTHLL